MDFEYIDEKNEKKKKSMEMRKKKKSMEMRKKKKVWR